MNYSNDLIFDNKYEFLNQVIAYFINNFVFHFYFSFSSLFFALHDLKFL